ncbi:MAG TPA: helical backbone metal receptor, partial [bacterium]|nr:helical backbone metal receptor [bacterium]
VRRIVSMAPNLTEIVWALGAGDRIVGVSDFDRWPPEVQQLPRVGGYFNPDQEAIIRLEPDCVLMLAARSDIGRKIESLGIPVRSYSCESLADVYTVISELGDFLGEETRANHLIASMRADLSKLHSTHTSPPPVLICIGMTTGTLQNLYVAGGGSYLSDVLEILGYRNVFRDVEQAYFPVSKETLIAARPEVILDIVAGQELTEDRIRDHRETWRLLPSLPAVRTDTIIILNQDFLLIPGPRIVETARVFAREIPVRAGALDR